MTLFALIPLLPLLGFLIITLGGKRLGDSSHRIGIPAVGLSAALAVAAFHSVAASGPISIPLYTLIDVGAFSIAVDLYIDQLTVLLLLLVTIGSFVVHVYSASYMIGDPRYRRYFAVIGLFTFAMVLLVMSNNLLVTYMCWEIMGLCSYLLISHWAHRQAAAKAATKAFLVNAVADVGLGFGVIFTLAAYGTLNIQEILAAVPSVAGSNINLLGWLGFEWLIERNTLITFCLLSGALGKSAQFPLHVWLPFAMEAPTPISALIHAATMVNAGPFLLARMSPVVLSAPSAMAVIAVVGMTTAVYGGLVALTQSDIKKSLAYSTISHIGFMIFACGVGAFVAAIFHLLAHGFLKGFLFLSTGDALESAGGHGRAKSSERVSGPVSIGALMLALIPAVVIFSGPY
jgi:NADH-quinone oxidoreductase subunit L